ncbi:bifunctional adenosylcobinamide kinase/adenosylcobinamide-phosphate guanylyltransferase [Anaerosporobacter faecicola]|uniref:bifunctional adenosylcobinamide kinase/adenosylcobinamide-phosphate guanylyltransferase n=1 Tax=Anaerosporobacter faecicola TaxID=2718714 RepID=UPI00143A52FB|nr:bifunctional adenosylcobinamide kinase/adenosylcobinamide-phosphate guanylyltransferase [Anaerosporobacter faecicola]
MEHGKLVKDMRLVIGGTAQGKLTFAKEFVEKSYADYSGYRENEGNSCRIVDETYTKLEELYEATIINHFHLIVRRMLSEKVDISEIVEQIVLQNPQVILVTTEIGYGIVPIDKFERNYREQTGRICCTIAKKSQEVYRITCGIPMQLK